MTKRSSGSVNAKSGVNYRQLNVFKEEGGRAAKATFDYFKMEGFRPLVHTFGGSAFVMETPSHHTSQTHEGLGSKDHITALVAAGLPQNERQLWVNVAIDNAAMALNDNATRGGRSAMFQIHVSAGASQWFANQVRAGAIAEGTRQACEIVGCVYGGGETPALVDTLYPDSRELSCSVVGFISPKGYLIDGTKLMPGDEMIALQSTGIGANGLTPVRKNVLPRIGYEARVPGTRGEKFWERLLRPTRLYGPVIQACQEAGIDIHQALPITGGGFKKLDRVDQPLIYRVDQLGRPQAEFKMIQAALGATDEEMHETFNMGVGYVLCVPRSMGRATIGIANRMGCPAWRLGSVERTRGSRSQVRLEQFGIRYRAD